MKEDSKSPITSEGERLQAQLQELVRTLHAMEYQQRSSLLGRVLTVTDAAVTDPAQRKAVKDLIEQAFWTGRSPGEKSELQYEVEQVAKANDIAFLFEPDKEYPAISVPNKYADIK